MASVPTGSLFLLASTLVAAKAVTAITNATEAVITATAHGLVVGDLFVLSSGWSRIDGKVYRVKASADANTFTVEGLNTTDTTLFPAGSGLGSVRKVGSLTQVSKVLGVNNSGGDAKSVQYRYMELDTEFSLNDGFSASTYSLDIDADTVGTPAYTLMQSLTDSQAQTVLVIQARNGSRVLYPCTVALNENVKLQAGQVNTVTAVFSGSAKPTRYAT